MPNVSILITQCLQRDFVDPVRPYDPLPNRLHVGSAEAQRLLGADPAAGPVAQVMSWARAQPGGILEIVHIRDWHDPNDPRQSDHLRKFGNHCLQNTPGAELVLGLDSELPGRLNEHVVDSIALNDFEDTRLHAVLEDILKRANGGAVRCGVIGVWTEAKVSYLLYDLKTRVKIDELATCSALTASASRAQHFNAMEQLNRILSVNCFDSVGEFTQWLAPGSNSVLPVTPTAYGHHVKTTCGQPLGEADANIVGYLFRDSSRVELDPLSGGFSGNLVFRASSHDAMGHQQAPSVAKLGDSKGIGAERVAFERVEEILGNYAPSVRGFVDLNGRAGIKYSFAGMGQGAVRTFKKLYESGAPSDKIEAVLRSVFEEILAPFYAAARYERLPLLEHYGFSSKYAQSVRASIDKVVAFGETQGTIRRVCETKNHLPERETLVFNGNYIADHAAAFYENFLGSDAGNSNECHYVSYVHGDLNGANILIDGHENVWIIDFFHAARGHVLKDLAKLENDILYIYTPISNARELSEALEITRALRKITDLQQELGDLPKGVESPQFVRAWAALRVLRSIAAKICREDRHPIQLSIAALRFSIHTLTFDESSDWQKQWALAAACGVADDIATTLKQDRALRLDWLDIPSASGRLGMTLCPGRKDRGRDLAADLDTLEKNGVKLVLSLLTDKELEWAGVPNLIDAARARGIEILHAPVPDGAAPGVGAARESAKWLLDGLRAGSNAAIHCMGGLGRTGTLAACVLIECSVNAEDSIARVRQSRGIRAIETREQENFVREFAGVRGGRAHV